MSAETADAGASMPPPATQAYLASKSGRLAQRLVAEGLTTELVDCALDLADGHRAQLIEVLRRLGHDQLATQIGSKLVADAATRHRAAQLAGMPEYDSRATAIMRSLEPLATLTTDEDDEGESLVLLRASDVQPETVEWLWKGWLPRGKLVVLDGDPGTGKSTLATDWCARLTTGHAFPGDDSTVCAPADVMYLSAEDDPADTIVPRLIAAGADLTRVCLPQVVLSRTASDERVTEYERGFYIPEDIPLLVEALEQTRARLVVIDVLMAYLSPAANSYRDQDIRSAFRPLATAAQASGATVLLLRHLSKSGGENSLYRGGGSIGIIGAARVGLLVAKHPNDPARLVLSVTKSNLAMTAESLVLRLVPDVNGAAARVEYEGASELQADQLLRPVRADRQKHSDPLHRLILDLLKDGPIPANEGLERCIAQGHSRSAVYRALHRLNVTTEQSGFGEAKTSTWLPPEDTDETR